jgi:hypothetical protein
MPDKHKMTDEEQQQMVEEMKKMEYEPLLPIEKKLIGYSIGLGIVLLFVFIWMSRTFFPNTTKLESPNAAVKAETAPAPAAAPVGAVPAAPAKKE